MADQKISELTALTGANVADDDAIAIVDTSATETKKIVFSELKNALDTATGFVRITGDTMTGNLSMGDNVKAIFGAGSDLEIYHNGTNSIIADVGTGNIEILGNNLRLKNADASNSYLNGDNGGGVTLYHAGTQKFITTSTGIDVTGNATFADNGKAIFGAGSDLQIYHDGSNSYIRDEGAGSLILTTNGTAVYIQKGDSETSAAFNIDGAVQLYHNNAAKFATTSTGVDVTGTITSDGLTVKNPNVSGEQVIFKIENAANTGTIGKITYNQTDDSMAISNESTGILRFDTVATERMRIDSSGNVGIGTSSVTPYQAGNTTLEIDGGANKAELRLTNDTTGASANNANGAMFHQSGNATYLWNLENDILSFGTNNTERMRIDSAGRVGIGTSSPEGVLDLGTASTGRSLTFAKYNNIFGSYSEGSLNLTSNYYGDTTANAYKTSSTATYGAAGIEISGTGGTSTSGLIQFFVDAAASKTADAAFVPSERMRIDSSGQLTNTSNTTALAASFLNTNTSGYGMRVTTYSNATQYGLAVDSYGGGYSRDFTVGVDGNVNVLTGNLVIGTAGKGIDFSATSNGSGTTTSELLDDYEEGTWTPTITGGTLASDYQAGAAYQSTYTKIGRMVVLEFMISLSSITSGSHLMFTNLPFTSKSGIWGGGIWTNGWASEPSSTVRWWNSGTTLHFYESNGSGSVTQLTQGDMGTGGNIFGNIIYYTS